ncbi:MAG TPA: MFS transporter [Pyrinomonadaceae bacterium]|jgi:ACS family hexuronate transporter-like MFS transporter|nr:MFS transporter [Pyrinomonadaceae bacterium]
MNNSEIPTAAPALRAKGFVVHGLRWWIAALIFFATLINFIDRLTISILAPVITTQLHLTNLQFAKLTTWFLVAYTVSQGVSGKVYDRIGPRRGFTISILVWSLAACAHAFARGLVSLSSFRFILGIGEAGNWPGAARVIAEWFPVRQRAIGMGIFNSGVCVGSIIAPPLIVWLQLTFGWQAVFLFTGSLGFIWLALWLLFYESPERHRAITRAEYALIKENQPKGAAAQPVRWLTLLRFRQTWAIVLSRFLADPVWWLYVTWLPLYLYNARGFDLKKIGTFAWLPFLTADAGSLLGGWLSGHLISRGWSIDSARKTVIVASALCMMAGIPAAFATDAFVALAFISVITFGFQAWINNVQTLPSDFFPAQAVGAVAGLGGVGAGIGSILYVLTTGWVVDHFSYNPILIIASLLPLLGTVILFVLAGRIGPITNTELETA